MILFYASTRGGASWPRSAWPKRPRKRPPRDRMRCPKCRHDRLSVIEVHAEVGVTDPGVVRLDDRGNLIPPSNFWFSGGDPISVELQCGRCRHRWTPKGKRAVSSDRS